MKKEINPELKKVMLMDNFKALGGFLRTEIVAALP
jgi:hypothetical protein